MKGRALYILYLIGFLIPFSRILGVEIPLDFHGKGFIGKYLNSDTSRYNMDASIELYCTILKYRNFSFFVRYRDDLDMAEQTGGVSLDPRYAHYYIVTGFDNIINPFLFSLYFMHDCVHDIDYEVEGTPVFNRFRLQFADSDFHTSRRLFTDKRFLWSIELGLYPHWRYNGWDINAGADYQYEIILFAEYHILTKGNFGFTIKPYMQFTKGDTCVYHQHSITVGPYYKNNGQRIGVGLTYNILNTDVIKDPDKLWLSFLFVEF